jgi:hypothetical protein
MYLYAYFHKPPPSDNEDFSDLCNEWKLSGIPEGITCIEQKIPSDDVKINQQKDQWIVL